MRTACIGVLATLSLAGLGACGTGEIGGYEGDNSYADPSLTIFEHTSTATNGAWRTADGTLAFTAAGSAADHVAITIDLNQHTFTATLNGDATTLDGGGAVLSAADRAVLSGFIDAFAVKYDESAAFSQDGPLQGLAMYLAMSPEGFGVESITTAPAVDRQGEMSTLVATSTSGTSKPVVGDEGIKCVRTGTTVTAAYAGKTGAVVTESIVVGSDRPNNYGCMGRCGSGCGGFGGGWTKDCLDHDACSYRFKSTGGSRDLNCGDEYKAATDDFLRSGSCSG